MRKNNEYGRTIMEMILYLSIIAVISIAFMRVIGVVLDKFKLSRVGEQVIEISKGVTIRYMAVGRYDNLTIDELVADQAVPKDMVQNGNVLVHAYGGRVRINGLKDTFNFSFQNLPKPACVELSLLNWVVDDSTNLVSVDINGKKYTWTDKETSLEKPLPVTMSDAATFCEDGNNPNTITWEFE